MKYNAKYDRWFSKEGLVYRYDKKQDKLVLCNLHTLTHGYVGFAIRHNGHGTSGRVHKAIWETFMGEIPEGYEIDHINTDKTDNRLENLRCVTHKENINNPLTLAKMSKSKQRCTGYTYNRKCVTDFGIKFRDKFGSSKYSPRLYNMEYNFYRRHGYCRWEVENG